MFVAGPKDAEQQVTGSQAGCIQNMYFIKRKQKSGDTADKNRKVTCNELLCSGRHDLKDVFDKARLSN